MGSKVNRERGLDGRHGNMRLHESIVICCLKLPQRQITTTPFDRTGQLLECGHIVQ